MTFTCKNCHKEAGGIIADFMDSKEDDKQNIILIRLMGVSKEGTKNFGKTLDIEVDICEHCGSLQMAKKVIHDSLMPSLNPEDKDETKTG